MNILIVYATKYGSVNKAVYMLESFFPADVGVDIVDVLHDTAPPLEDYDTVILGGSIHVGRIQKEIRQYAEQNLETLLTKRVGLFICAAQDPPTSWKELEQAFPRTLFESAIYKDVFGYEIYYDKLSLVDRLIISTVKGTRESEFMLSEPAIEEFAQAMTKL